MTAVEREEDSSKLTRSPVCATASDKPRRKNHRLGPEDEFLEIERAGYGPRPNGTVPTAPVRTEKTLERQNDKVWTSRLATSSNGQPVDLDPVLFDPDRGFNAIVTPQPHRQSTAESQFSERGSPMDLPRFDPLEKPSTTQLSDTDGARRRVLEDCGVSGLEEQWRMMRDITQIQTQSRPQARPASGSISDGGTGSVRPTRAQQEVLRECGVVDPDQQSRVMGEIARFWKDHGSRPGHKTWDQRLR
jgi:hypothetical protein